MQMKLAEMRDVVFGYGPTPVVEGLNLEVRTSEFIGLTGPNGAAKTTTLKLLLGLLSPQRGTVERAKRNEKGGPLVVGYLPQQIAAFNTGFPSTVWELVRSGLFQRTGWIGLRQKRDDAKKVEHVLHQVNMWEHRKKKIGELSGGQKQRVCLARALVTDPDLLVLDEPTTGMDANSRTLFYDLLDHQVRHHGRTVLMVTHDLEETLPKLTRLLVIDKWIRFSGTPEDFRERMDMHRDTSLTVPLYCCYDDNPQNGQGQGVKRETVPPSQGGNE
ncbi:MAG TPA: metal ABC transporter ATP-binding protein [Bacilli bacterium]|nr:metal ABC transporter ATP-binding protein [Bacilli bacterium]